ncbi:hypothetical protein [Deinococcus enclensis]|uniref:Outer membrane protein assembly factor BamE (Lipoprotein component of BamABCDE complex) n=1 Tax=Deinococcus enclensis TaxID=1049582 RepID=A0ABT9MEY8_9DEIO|nr:hypothetical protein [Deinococcus enclensis]MDP9765139.1 outer membrane protein assembly factor BamE (lipoprotein component of BamABCDE complex) [Deinococcus enclensis]
MAPRTPTLRRRMFPWLAALLLTSAAGVITYRQWGIFRTEPFNAAVWQAPLRLASDPVCHRGRMVADLQARHLRPNLSRAQVERLLGPPDWTQSGAYYLLGTCRGGRTPFDVLYLYYGLGDRLTTFSVMGY